PIRLPPESIQLSRDKGSKRQTCQKSNGPRYRVQRVQVESWSRSSGLGPNPQIAAGNAGKPLAINHLTVREISYVQGVLTTDSHVRFNNAQSHFRNVSGIGSKIRAG